CLPAEYQPRVSISDEFFRRRSEIVQSQLITAEDKNPALASAIQAIIEEYKLDDSGNEEGQ
ncbi:MAG: hypothetical protein ABIQ12_05670, partial [Opitutaceae bacterium]